MAAADNILKNEIDPLMELVKDSDPAFYNQYKAAQVIIDFAARHSSGNGKAEATLETSPPVSPQVPELAKAA